LKGGGGRRIGDHLMPLVDSDVCCSERRSLAVTVVEYVDLLMSVVSALSLPKGAARSVTLGDSTTKVFEYCTADVMWDGRRHRVRVLCVEGDPLIGTALLSGYKLDVDFEPGGAVTLRNQIVFSVGCKKRYAAAAPYRYSYNAAECGVTLALVGTS
jgi:hypothetical protein